MSELADAIWSILRRRAKLADPRITYKELALSLRDASDDFDHITARNPKLYAALIEIGDRCRELELPMLPALVVRADTRRPGDGFFDGPGHRGEKIAAWREEVVAVRAAKYPNT